MKTMTLTLIAAGALLAGCSGSAEPADPPTSEDALTTSETAPTTDTAPTTEAPPDDVVETSSPPDVVETTEAAGPPELPDEATEDSEAGAAAFAEHYISMLNYTAMNPEVGLLKALRSAECEACLAFEEPIAYSEEHQEAAQGATIEVIDLVPIYNVVESEANVRVNVLQLEQDYVDRDGKIVDSVQEDEATIVFTLSWEDTWTVDALRVEADE